MMFRYCTALIALALVFSAASGASLESLNNVDNEELIQGLEATKSFNLEELAKIGAYLYKISKKLPTVCYVRVVVSCKSEKTFDNFKACAEGYIAENPNECKNLADELLDLKKANLQELVKIAAYIFKISQQLPTVCFAKVIYTCKGEEFFKNFKACVEGYIAENPDECENPSEATELLQNPEVSREITEWELVKIVLYIRKMSKTVSTNCFVKLIVKCKESKTYNSFKTCADKYVNENQISCASSRQIFFGQE